MNEISDLKYFLEYIDNNKSGDSCLSPKCFNHLYNYLRIIPINDSSWVFVRNICLSEYDKNDFLLLFENDSIKIYKPLEIMCETFLLDDYFSVYLKYRDAIENENDSFDITFDFDYNNLYSYYSKRRRSDRIENNYQYEFNSLWKSDNCRYFLYYEYDNHWNLGQSYVYKKTIKTPITEPSLSFCMESNLCCPFPTGAYPEQEQAKIALRELRQRLW